MYFIDNLLTKKTKQNKTKKENNRKALFGKDRWLKFCTIQKKSGEKYTARCLLNTFRVPNSKEAEKKKR